ncbi:MAG: hypothetical protein PHU56_00230 [Candidatus Pacebacteria bacterium]|nr:hypothetical protein [Candidatus Paceibacterota bacterium]
MSNDIQKYDSVLAAVEFDDSINKLQNALDENQVLKDKQLTLGLLDPQIKKLNEKRPAEVFVSLNRIQFQEKNYILEKSADIINVILSLDKARKTILSSSISNNIKFCGAIIALTYDIEGIDIKEAEMVDKIFNFKKTKKEIRNFNFKSADNKFNYNIVMEYSHGQEAKSLKINFDVNNIYQVEEKRVEQLSDVIAEIKSKVDNIKDFFSFIHGLL